MGATLLLLKLLKDVLHQRNVQAAPRQPATPVPCLPGFCQLAQKTHHLSDVGSHITCMKGSARVQDLVDLLQTLASMGLGEGCQGRRLPNNHDGLRTASPCPLRSLPSFARFLYLKLHGHKLRH